MSKRLRMAWRRQLFILVAAITLLVGMALPVLSPYLSRTASAADAVPAIDVLLGGDAGTSDRIAMNPAEQWTHKLTCVPTFEPRILDAALIQQATGFPNFDQWIGKNINTVLDGTYGSSTENGMYDKVYKTGPDAGKPTPGSTNYLQIGLNAAESKAGLQFWLDHLGKKVNVVSFYNSAGAAGNIDSCGAPGAPHFILIPIAANGDDATKLIGRQVTWHFVDNNKYADYDYSGPGAPIVYTKSGLIDNGANTQGTMSFYTPEDRYVTQTTTVAGISLKFAPTGYGVGSITSANFRDAAHIDATYTTNGKTFKEVYTDFRWDGLKAYFLTSSEDPARSAQTVTATGQDHATNPHTNPSSSKAPFIETCGPPINFSPRDGSGIAHIQNGIDHMGCDTSSFYDYAPDGSVVGDAPQGGLSNPLGINVGSADLSHIWFYASGQADAADQIVNVFQDGDGNERPYTGVYARNAAVTQNPTYDLAGSDCPYLGRLTIVPSVLALPPTIRTGNWTLNQDGVVCQKSYGTLHVLVATSLDQFNNISQGGLGNDPATNNGAPPKVVCDVELNPLTWLICPFATGAISLAGTLDNAINDMLNISVNTYLDESGTCGAGNSKPGPCFYTAWASFRVLAMAVIVIAGLAMIISQALGADILDAYTIKKILPRLLIIVILIAISWQLLKAAITLSDIIGYGVRGLIYKPFSGFGAAHIQSSTSTALAVLGGGAFLGLGVLGLLSFAVTALLAVFIGFALLVFREMVVIFMVIVAPLALALSILPNTRKGYKLWADTTFGALLMFPIIAGFIAIGHVFALVVYNVNASGIISQFIFVIAYFAPYFMIPLAFRLAGGLVATVGGVVNDRSKGAFDRLKNFRSNRIKTNAEKMRTGERFSNNTGLGRAFNNTTEGLNTFAHAESKFGFLTDQNVRRAAYQEQRQMNSSKHAQSARGQVAKENDPVLQAQTFRSEEEARRGMFERFGATYDAGTAAGRQNLDAAIGAARANGGFSAQRQDYATRRLAATGTGYANLDQMHRTVAAVAGNNRAQASSLLGEMNAVTKGVGRHDLATGYGTQMALYDALQARGGGGGLTTAEVQRGTVDAIKGTDIVTLLRDKTQSMENTMPALRQELVVQQQRSGNMALTPMQRQDADAEAGRLTGIIESVAQNSTYASPINIQRSNELVVQPTAGQQPGMMGPVSITGNRQEVTQAASPILLQYNPITGGQEPVYATRAVQRPQTDPLTGAPTGVMITTREIITDPVTGNRIPMPNPTYDPVAAAAYKAQRPNGTLSPNDPRYGT